MSPTTLDIAPASVLPAFTDVFDRIQAEANAQQKHLPDYRKGLDAKWEAKTASDPKRLIDSNGRIRQDAFRNFRREQLFVPDTPATDYSTFNLRNSIDGVRRGEKRLLKELYDRLERLGHLDTLRKYPCPTVGNPYLFHYRGTTYTYRWHKHMHFIDLAERFLRSRLSPNFTGLDLGSSYGIFPGLMKKEYPESRWILVDFPEQLLMAYYYLSHYHPGARIAGTQELHALPMITAESLRNYDFVLIPVSMYSRLSADSVDLYTNFASLGEMRREWFNGYLESPVYKTARYFFTANRYESAPTYDTDVTVLDYPIWDPSKRLHFTTSPVFSHIYTRRKLISFERLTYPQYFEYIGRVSQR